MFWKKSIADYDTDDENDEVDEFVKDEEEITELTRILQQSGLTKAHMDLRANKYQHIQEEPFMHP